MNKWIALMLAAILLIAGFGSAFAEEAKGKLSVGLGGGLFDVAQENKYLTIGKEFTARVKYGIFNGVEIGILSGYSSAYVSDRLTAFPHRLFRADGTPVPYAPWGSSALQNDGRFRWDKSEQVDAYLQRIPVDVFVQFRGMASSIFNPYLQLGMGMELWSMRDGAGSGVLQVDMSEGDSVINNTGEVLLSGSYPKQDFSGTQWEFMIGGGFEIFPIEHLGLDINAKVRWPFGRDFYKLGLDIPRAYVGVGAIVTYYFEIVPQTVEEVAKVDVKDDDGDGVPNARDKCPNTTYGCVVDSVGCPLDTDKDGVCDGVDQCPNTPKGILVTANGCPKDIGDEDKDGIMDNKDKCPNTPSGCLVDSLGCSLDSDKDGVCDGLDKCPKTMPCAVVDASGCGKDTDGDGVYDGCDKCPNTPKTGIDGKPIQVDSTGCARIDYTKKAVESDKGLQVRVEFDEGKSNVKESEAPKLLPVLEIMKVIPELKLEVGGHTNSNGSDASNQKLSERRANAVRDYLITAGVSRDRITTAGYGERELVDDNGDRIAKTGKAEDKIASRRIEFHRLDKAPTP